MEGLTDKEVDDRAREPARAAWVKKVEALQAGGVDDTYPDGSSD